MADTVSLCLGRIKVLRNRVIHHVEESHSVDEVRTIEGIYLSTTDPRILKRHPVNLVVLQSCFQRIRVLNFNLSTLKIKVLRISERSIDPSFYDIHVQQFICFLIKDFVLFV